MAHDLIVRNGLVVDGTGAPARRADVAVQGDRIVEVGDVDGEAARVIDADGRYVTPGFVDIHTHLDAQLFWDGLGTSSCWHGVTSIVIGNCGVTFAPCRPEDRGYLAEMMESVEDIPRESIMQAMPWDWETYGEYLASLDRVDLGMNVAGLVGHCAVRYNAMGERSLDPDSEPTPEELDRMVAAVDSAMAAGAVGFSTSRTIIHLVPDGRVVPGTHATIDELGPLCEVLARHGRGVIEGAALLGEQNGADEESSVDEVALFAELSRRTGRPASFGLTQTNGAPALYRHVLDLVAEENRRGADLKPQTTVRSIGVLFGLSNRTPWDRFDSWRALRDLPLDEKLDALRDPERRRRLVQDAAGFELPFDRWYVMDAERPDYDFAPEDSVAYRAVSAGLEPVDLFIDMALESGGGAVWNMPFLNQSMDAIADMQRSEDIVMGLADAGAHVGQILDASQPTYWLSHWVRDVGLCSMEEGIRRLTSDTADLFGLQGRGRIREGAFADLNVFDLDSIALSGLEYVHDLPAGAGRWTQGSGGYAWTIVNGVVLVDHGEHTGAYPGRVLRSTD